MIGLLLPLLVGSADAAPLLIETSRSCPRYAEASADSTVVDTVEAGLRTEVLDLSGESSAPWLLVKVGGTSGWLAPDCEAQQPGATASEASTPAKSEPRKPSYGGIFLGRAGSSDPVLGAGLLCLCLLYTSPSPRD